MKYTITAILMSAMGAVSLSASESTVLHTINGDGFVLDAPAEVTIAAAQTLQGDVDSVAFIEAVAGDPFTVKLLDKRGINEAVYIDANLAPLEHPTGVVRSTTIVAQNAGGANPAGATFAAPVTASVATDITALAQFDAMVNRQATFDIQIGALGLTGSDAMAGEYTGSLTLTIR